MDKKRRPLSSIFISAILSGLILTGILYFMDVGYVGWIKNSKFEVLSATIKQTMTDSGVLHVQETIVIKMVKPYRGVYRTVKNDEHIKITDFECSVSGGTTYKVEYQKTNTKSTAKIWLIPSYSSERTDNKTYTMHCSYTATNVLESGNGISQLFRQYWGSEWNSPAKMVKGIFIFPETMMPDQIYMHPKAVVKKKEDRYEFKINSLTPNGFAEVRFIFNKAMEGENVYTDEPLTLSQIKAMEFRYQLFRWLDSFLALIVYIVMIALSWRYIRKLHKETQVETEPVYSREIPFNDPPELVNAIIINKTEEPDSNAISAVLLDLARKGYIAFRRIKGSIRYDMDYIIIKDETGLAPISEDEMDLFKLLKEEAVDGVFDARNLREKVEKERGIGFNFIRKLEHFSYSVRAKAKARQYINTSGFSGILLFSIMFLIASILILPFINHRYNPDILTLGIAYTWLYLSTAIYFFMLYTKQGIRWTKEGQDYYSKWIALKEFLSEVTNIEEHPPVAIHLWGDFLVYGCALGEAKAVQKAFREISPEIELPEEGTLPLESGQVYAQFYDILSVFDDNIDMARSIFTARCHVHNTIYPAHKLKFDPNRIESFGDLFNKLSKVSKSSGSSRSDIGGGSGGGGGGAF